MVLGNYYVVERVPLPQHLVIHFIALRWHKLQCVFALTLYLYMWNQCILS